MSDGRRQRRPKGSPPPTSHRDVPRWLAENYELEFVEGQPLLADWAYAVERADAALDSETLWHERILQRGDEAADPSSAKRTKAAAQVAKSERALRSGKPYPRVRDVALSEFVIALSVSREIPFEAIAMLAWWKGYLNGDPRNPDTVRALQRLVERRWNGEGRLDGVDF